MSGQLESALVLSLTDAIKWESALGPVDDTGVMTTVNPEAPLDVTKYGRRDRELAYRDIINAAAILKVSLEIETVFGGTPVRPKVEGLTTEIMPATTGDLGLVSGQVVHVKNSSLPIDALATDKDLAGRDALLFEVLSRACQVFSSPPLTPNDPASTSIPGVTAWSQAESLASRREVNPALPLDTNAFYLPDRNLADRDNQIAAYVSRLCQILKNPFAFADRLYVRIDNVNDREVEIFALIRVYYEAGNSYNPDEEVYHGTTWWRAVQYTDEEPTTVSTDWLAIDAPTERIFQADPNLLGRNRIVYNTGLKTLQWVSESLTEVHTPQIFALSIPGPQLGQFVTTVPAVPEAKDSEFWRQKASRITYEGTLATHLDGYHDTTVFQTGVIQADTTGLTGAGNLTFPFVGTLAGQHKYRFSALVKPSQDVTILGGYNNLSLPGTLGGVTFTGDYQPTPGVAGNSVPFSITLPSGGWELTLKYTDLDATTDGFGTKITNNGVTIMEDAAPLLFQNQNGVKFAIGDMVESNPVFFTSTGGVNNLNVQWTYGEGSFHIRQLTFFSSDRKIGRYSMRLDVTDAAGNTILSSPGSLSPSVDTWGERDIYNVMPFDFVPSVAESNPDVILKWLPESDQMPLQVRQVQLEEVVPLMPNPEFGGFLSWKQECLYRAFRAINTSYATFISQTAAEDMPDFTLDGTLWDKSSTNAWMTAIETYHPRLRNIPDVSIIEENKHYLVVGGYAVYDGGTYSDGEKFYGTNTSDSVLAYGGRIDQQGAFQLSYPGHIGKPAILPLGLYYDNTDVRMSNPTSRQTPVLTVCQPWMIEAGIYVAHEDFWSPESLVNDVEQNHAEVDVYPDSMALFSSFGTGVSTEVVHITTAAADSMCLGAAYSFTFAAAGGLKLPGDVYDWFVSAGTLPPGLSLNTVTGEVSGTPTNSWESTFTMQVEDANGDTWETSYTVCVVEFTSSATMTDGIENEAYSYTVETTPVTSPVALSYAVTSGALPDGLTLNTATGEVSGTPTTDGDYSFTITASSSDPVASCDQACTLKIWNPTNTFVSRFGGGGNNGTIDQSIGSLTPGVYVVYADFTWSGTPQAWSHNGACGQPGPFYWVSTLGGGPLGIPSNQPIAYLYTATATIGDMIGATVYTEDTIGNPTLPQLQALLGGGLVLIRFSLLATTTVRHHFDIRPLIIWTKPDNDANNGPSLGAGYDLYRIGEP